LYFEAEIREGPGVLPAYEIRGDNARASASEQLVESLKPPDRVARDRAMR
jgi:hypothetical protein